MSGSISARKARTQQLKAGKELLKERTKELEARRKLVMAEERLRKFKPRTLTFKSPLTKAKQASIDLRNKS